MLSRVPTASFNPNRDFNAIMYADDILLLSSSVNLLQNLLASCEREFLKINLKFNVSKSASLRIVARHKIVIPELTDLSGTPIRWVSEFIYLGVVVKHEIRFGINVHQTKLNFSDLLMHCLQNWVLQITRIHC